MESSILLEIKTSLAALTERLKAMDHKLDAATQYNQAQIAEVKADIKRMEEDIRELQEATNKSAGARDGIKWIVGVGGTLLGIIGTLAALQIL